MTYHVLKKSVREVTPANAESAKACRAFRVKDACLIFSTAFTV